MSSVLDSIDKRLWFTMDCCRGRHYVIGNPHTHAGRIYAWCPIKDNGFCVSKSEMKTRSPELEIWIDGYLHGNEVPAPELESDAREFWIEERLKFHEEGTWPQPGWRSSGVIDDSPEAAKRGLSIEICTKDAPDQDWKEQEADFETLEQAVRLAAELEAHEVAVFVEGSRYWSTEDPVFFNSFVVWMDRE